MDIFLGPRFSLAPGLSLETRGENVEVTNDENSLESSLRLLYLQLPLLVRLHVPAGGASLNLFMGPEMGVILSKEVTAKLSSPGRPTLDTSTTDIDVKTFDVGLTLGAGLRTSAVSGLGFFFEPSFYLGLRDIPDPKDDPSTPKDESDAEFKNRNFKLKIGFYRNL